MSGAEVVVVGGGPAGLAAALAAARAGRQVQLLEAGPRLGGMAASTVVAGQRVDLGSHRLHPSAPPPVAALLEELLGDDLQVRVRRGRLHLRDRWVAFPLQLGDLARSSPPSFTAAAALDVATRPLRRARADTYAELVRAGLGPTALRHFHGPMATKLWGVEPQLLAGELARRRLPVRGPSSLVRGLLRARRPEGRLFRYPRLGYGQVVDRLAEAAVGAGVAVRTGATVQRVEPGHGRVRLHVDGEGSTAGRVLWTAPLEPLVRAVPDAPADLAAGARHRALVLVYLVVPRPRYHHTDAHYVPDRDVAFARLSEPKNYRDGPDPQDRTVLCAEVPCSVGDGTWTAGDEDLAALVLDGMGRCSLPLPPVAEVAVRRLPRVYPSLTPADVPARARLLAWAEALPGVAVLGRQGLLVADNLHHVLDMALSAAACTGPEGRWDDRAWAGERQRFDRFVVDD